MNALSRTEAETTAILDLFVSRVRELLSLRLVQSGQLDASLSIKGRVNQPMEIHLATPDEELLRSFLLTFRQFVSKSEPIYLESVANILWKSTSGAGEHELLDTLRRSYRQALRYGPVGFTRNGANYSPFETLQQWINGHYFHNNREFAEQLASRASDPTSEIFLRHALMTVLVEGSRYAKYLAECTTYWRSTGILTV